MTQVTEALSSFMTKFAIIENPVIQSHQPAWLIKLRQAGIAQFDRVGFPTTKIEEWRDTNVSVIARTKFDLATHVELDRASIKQYAFGDAASAELVFVNGFFDANLSTVSDLPRGLTVGSLAEAITTQPDFVQKHLTHRAKMEKNPFVALNTGFIADGAFIHLAKSAAVGRPIHLLFISVESDGPTVAHPRNLIVAEDNAEATIASTFVSIDSNDSAGVYFDNVVTEIIAGDDCRIDSYVIQQESKRGYHISTTDLKLGKSSQYINQVATIGAKLTRNDFNVLLAGESADATLNGLVMIGDDQHCDNHTLLEHAAPNCPSYELYKYLMSGKSTGVFKGKIHVHQAGQKTAALQRCKTLLLSDDAVMNSQPALEIYADDVKCTHGSTIGPVDEDMIFYLRSRGISEQAARHMLSYAFAANVTRRIKVPIIRQRIESVMASQHGLPLDIAIIENSEHDMPVL